MRLPSDYEERTGITPVLVSAMVAVTLFVGAILVLVLMINRKDEKVPVEPDNSGVILTEETEEASGSGYPDTWDLVTGSTLSPTDLDFWDSYPPQVSAEASVEPDAGTEAQASSALGVANEEVDPATDGKHTLVQYADGKEEWVLISPYLPKHDYDYTKLVCQSDLMKYYEDGKQVSFVGVDISKYQDYVDFVKLKKAGVDFVMIRVGARGYGTGQLVIDEYFYDNIKRASDAGLEIGLYFFSQAVSVEEAVEEANLVLENIGDYQVDYPIAFDMEYIPNDSARIDSLNKTDKTTITKAFLDTVQAAGYVAMIYGNKEWLIKEIDMSKLTAYDVWLSQAADIPDYPYKFAMWQYKTNALIDGISGYANLNISFIDYSEK
ncbi:MAG: glycoside hydrolase family 25 protein [Candidatus Gastranaerophilales bacterium]|nr:glycoside hydrolase family 25 protein [Candidatus Gastranaerophilales bacterium]